MWIRALILSLVIHMCLMVFLNETGDYSLSQRPHNQPLEVTLIEPKENEKSPEAKTLVLSAPAREHIEAPEKKARFFSESDQRVSVETQAREAGLTENRKPGQPQLKDLNLKPSFTQQQNAKDVARAEGVSEEGVAVQKVSKKSGRRNAIPLDLNPGLSMVNEPLPNDIKIGDFTALNTDQHRFYTFYARIAPLLRFHWVQNVESAIGVITQRGFYLPSKQEWTTVVEVILDRKGYFQSAMVERSSSLDILDQAVIKAFKTTTPYLNPPSEMIQPNGQIHLLYKFSLEWDPRRMARNY